MNMKRIIRISTILLLASGLVLTGCSASKKGSCGCPAKQGIIGYK